MNGEQFNEIPWVMVLYVEHNQMIIAKWIEGTKYKGCRQCTEERPPQCLQREVVAHLQNAVLLIWSRMI